jgi:hypothetical protein
LAARFRAEGIRVEGGTLVTLAPHAEPRGYDGLTAWDAGLLFADSERITYVGELTRFCLNREAVRAVRLVSGHPGWGSAPAVLVEWEGGLARLMARGASRRATRRLTEKLAARLAAWEPGDPGPDGLPAGPPVFGEVTSTPEENNAGWGAMLAYALQSCVLATAAAGALGLHVVGDALPAVAASVIVSVLPFLPYRFRRRRKRAAATSAP